MGRYFPTAAASSALPGGMTSDPNDLPVFDGTSGTSLYDGGAEYTADTSNFWSELERSGAYVTGAVDDTYKEICSLTGAGKLFHVVSPTPTNTSDTVGFRITVDGVVHEILKSQTWGGSGGDNKRVVIGVCVQNTSFYTTANSFMRNFADQQSDTVFNQNGTAVLMSPSVIMNYCMPLLRFKESLIVETKVTDVYTGGTYGAYCGASYIQD